MSVIIKATTVLKTCGLDSCLSALEHTELDENYKLELRLLSCAYALPVLPIFEAKFPGDRRPREVIEASRRFALGEIGRDELSLKMRDAWDAMQKAQAKGNTLEAEVACAACCTASKNSATAAGNASSVALNVTKDGGYGMQRQMLQDVLVKLEAKDHR